MQIKPLSLDTIQNITNCFNRAFEDYFVQFNATPQYLFERWTAAGVDYSISYGCYVKNKLVGFIVHGINPEKNEVYNAGTGVIPEFRRRGVVQKLYEVALSNFQKVSIKTIRLEVITKNNAALRAYQRLGFIKKRELLCFKGRVKVSPNGRYKIRKTNTINPELYHSFLDFQPSWENDFVALLRKQDPLLNFEVMADDQIIGFGIRFSDSGYIPLLAIHPEFRRTGAGKDLISSIASDLPEVRVNNVDEKALPMIDFLTDAGLKNHLNQYEMSLSI